MIRIINWAGDYNVKKKLQSLGYSHGQEIDIDIFEVAKIFFSAGLYVMLLPGSPNIIAVDNCAFHTR